MTFNVLCITYCRAELFDGSVHFYIKGGEALTASTKVRIVYFERYNEKLYCAEVAKSIITENLQKNSNCYEDPNKRWSTFWDGKYQPSISTSKRDVHGKRSYTQRPYTGSWYPGCPLYENIPDNYYIYRGFAKDKSSFIWWKEDLDGNILDKVYYIEVKKEDLMPKTVNRDFLND